MNNRDKIKLSFTRNWKFPGVERLARILRSSPTLRNGLKNGITWLNNEPVAIYTIVLDHKIVGWELIYTSADSLRSNLLCIPNSSNK